MSLNDPTRRPWGTAQGARFITLSAWAIIAGLSLATAVCAVPLFSGDLGMEAATFTLFIICTFASLGALGIDLALASRSGDGDVVALPRLPGAWLTGGGIGTMIAAALPGRPLSLLSLLGLMMFAAGVATFFSPTLLERYRSNKTIRHGQIRSAGVHTQAQVTEVSTFYREHFAHYRVTMRFTDQAGSPRWFTRNAPAGTRKISQGRILPLHYDPQNPGRRRTIVVDWPSYGG